MSITSCLLIFLICLSLHACSARRLGAVYSKNNKLEKKLHFPIKSNMKNGFKKNSVAVAVQQAKSTSSKELLSIKEESIEESHAEDDTDQKLEDADHVNPNKPVVSVSWRVPHGKRGEKYPVFNLDYSTPKTHPPSHN